MIDRLISPISRIWNACRSPWQRAFVSADEVAADADIKALYLLLLGRVPESAEIYSEARRRPSVDLAAGLLRSAEFNDRVFLSAGAMPHEHAESAELEFVREWVRRLGVPVAAADADWLEVFAILVTEGPAAALVRHALPEHISRLERRASEIQHLRNFSRPPVAEPDVKAVYLLLLGRLPESEAVYSAYRDGRGSI
jgi:hypothetical protein